MMLNTETNVILYVGCKIENLKNYFNNSDLKICFKINTEFHNVEINRSRILQPYNL